MRNSKCGIKRTVIISMLSWVEGNSSQEELKAAIGVYLDNRCGDPATKTSASDRLRCILIRWTVACGVMAPILRRVPNGKLQPLFDAVRSVACAEWDD